MEEARQEVEEKMTRKLQMPPVMEERDAASKVAGKKQKYRNIEIQKYRNTEIQKFRNTEIKIYRNTEVEIKQEKYRNTKTESGRNYLGD